MIADSKDMKNWRNEEIKHYREYLKNFSPSSKEYQLLSKGIEELEKTLL